MWAKLEIRHTIYEAACAKKIVNPLQSFIISFFTGLDNMSPNKVIFKDLFLNIRPSFLSFIQESAMKQVLSVKIKLVYANKGY